MIIEKVITMERVNLNKNVSVSRIVQGLWRLNDWNWTIDETVKFIESCIARGVTTFDAADG
jgi:predicted oxidoreductase